MTTEFPEADMFTRATGEDWNAQVADWEKRNEVAAKVEAAQRAERKVAADALSRRANEAVLIHEYASQGLRAPYTDGNGVPTVSLAMLLRLGWTINRSPGTNILMRPFVMPQQPEDVGGF